MGYYLQKIMYIFHKIIILNGIIRICTIPIQWL